MKTEPLPNHTVMTLIGLAVLAYENADKPQFTTMEEALEHFADFVKHPERW